MSTLIIHHDDCLAHDTGPRHPECPGRIPAVLDAIKGISNLQYLPAPKAEDIQLLRAHPREHIDAVHAAEPSQGRSNLTEADTVMAPGSVAAALRAAGAVCLAIDEVCSSRVENAFCVVRPPGHHAEAQRAMGFCLFNSVAIGARHAQAEHGCAKVAILDFDVHHGNGTQAIFEQDPSVLFISSHQTPLYPGSGEASERGVGNIINIPLPGGSGSAECQAAWKHIALPAVDGFAPDLIMISAGFDAHEADPLAQLEWVPEDYAWLTREIRRLARKHCEGRLVSALEGGYDLEALGQCAREHVAALSD